MSPCAADGDAVRARAERWRHGGAAVRVEVWRAHGTRAPTRQEVARRQHVWSSAGERAAAAATRREHGWSGAGGVAAQAWPLCVTPSSSSPATTPTAARRSHDPVREPASPLLLCPKVS
jgi:hypothetical protein